MIFSPQSLFILLLLIFTITLAQTDQQTKNQTKTPPPKPAQKPTPKPAQKPAPKPAPKPTPKNATQKPVQTPPKQAAREPQPEKPKVEQKIQIPKPTVVDPIKIQVKPIISNESVLIENSNVSAQNNVKLENNSKLVDEQLLGSQVPISPNQGKSQKVQKNSKQTQQKLQKTQGAKSQPSKTAQQHAKKTGQANKVNPNDEKIKKEQARLQNQKRQRQNQEKKANVKAAKAETVFENDRKLSRSEQIKLRQRSEINSVYNQYDLSQPKKTVLFEVNTQIDQFLISPTTDSQIAIKMLIYTQENNAYGLVKDIEISKALKENVYENNDRIVGEGQFYYEKAFKFEAKAGAHYIFRFYNDGVLKLVSFTYPSLIQDSQMSNVLKKQQGKYHLEQIHFLDRRLEEITQRLRRNTLLDKVNNEVVADLLVNYSGYQFIQMLFVIVITMCQVQMVKKMFKVDSIL